jgi:hypothetical protein
LLLNRLKNFVTTELGPNIEKDISGLVVKVMEFVENKVSQDLEGSEKLQLVIAWVQKLLGDIGVKLPGDTLTLIEGFIGQICKATTGLITVNVPMAQKMPVIEKTQTIEKSPVTSNTTEASVAAGIVAATPAPVPIKRSNSHKKFFSKK